MKPQKFIDRPILSMVISVVILVAGLIGLLTSSLKKTKHYNSLINNIL